MTDARAIRTVHTVAELRTQIRKWRTAGETIALVPTMGALHAGHVALMEAARERASRVVVTIFVNPTQFAPTEDLSRYPRTLEADLNKAEAARTHLAFVPDVAEMYPEGFCTAVTLTGPALGLETEFRPTHFTGVATVVTKLLLQALPDTAFFGEKDYQQLQVITRLARDLDLPMEIVGVPTIREADGLALSSRNIYLSEGDRAAAPALYRALCHAAKRIARDKLVDDAIAEARAAVIAAGFDLDYLEARHAETLATLASPGEAPIRLLVAARIGGTRLIDNVAVPA